LIRSLAILATVLCTVGLCPLADAQPPAAYSAVEVDRFIPNPGVALPSGYPSALADDVARELSVECSTVKILREDTASDEPSLLRISGTVVQFKPGSNAGKYLPGFGATTATAQVRFADAATGRVLAIRAFHGAADSLGRKIAKFSHTDSLVSCK
jgi:hypothetical protein